MRSNRFIKLIVTTLVMTVFSASALFAQTTKLSGTVTDQGGLPIVGATVLITGTLNGTQTNFEGKWELKVSDPQDAVIQFSCLGYRTIEEKVGNKSVLNVALMESNEALDEVVVVGYGTQKKADLTGSVSSINFSDIAQNRTIINATAALAGLAPGMMVRQTSAQPGSESTTIRIRGTGSFTSSASSPLVLVDGVEWSLDNVNSNDIESISVLKDAASTAIYGARAANGVIIVTTKQGDEKRPRVSYSFNGVFQSPHNPNIAFVNSSADFFELVNESCENYGQDHVFSQSTIDMWRAADADPNGVNEYGVKNYIAYPNTDWFDALFRTSFTQKHDLTVTGGSKNVRYMISGSYLDDNGILFRDCYINSGLKKATLRTNVEADVTKWFTLGVKLYAQYKDRGSADVSSAFSGLQLCTPNMYPGKDGKYGIQVNIEDYGNNSNILYKLCGTNCGDVESWILNGSIYAQIRPYKGIVLEGTFNYSPTFRTSHQGTVKRILWDYSKDQAYSETTLDAAYLQDQLYRNYYATTELLARYNNTFNKIHELGVVLGYTTTAYETWSFLIQKKGATDWSLRDQGTYSYVNASSFSSRAGWALRSYFARANYAIKDRYLFEANVRADGSSKFGSNTRWGVFPSVSAGWKISDEPWMAGSSNWLSQLKLRASWGEVGNDQGIGNYTWQATYTTGSVELEGEQTKGLYISSMSNIDLKWETTATTDIGVDLGFFNNRLTSDMDYYYKATRDLLYTPSSYLTMGNFSNVAQNLGNMWNQGFELNLNWKDTIGGQFYYYAGVNFSYNKNKVTKYKGVLSEGYDEDGNWYTNYSDVAESWSSPGVLLEGHSIGEHYIYKLYNGTGEGYSGGTVDINAGPKDGMIRTEADMAWAQAMLDAGYILGGKTTIARNQLWYGDFVYADLNGDGYYGNSYDRYFSGHSSIPTYNLGINLGFAWKGLEFSMIWAGCFDYWLNWTDMCFNTTTARDGRPISARVAADHYFYDPDNPSDPRTNINGFYPRLYYNTINNSTSDWYEYKGDYMKLKSVTIGYTIPEKWTNKFFVKNLKIYVSGENLLTITKYPGLDPEIGTDVSYPLMKEYTIGAQITF